MMSIRIRSTSGVGVCSALERLAAVLGVATCIPCASSALVSANTLRTSSSTIRTLRPVSAASTSRICSSMRRLPGGERLRRAVQRERRLVQQPLRGPRVLDDDRLGVALEPRLLAPGQRLAGVDDHRDVAVALVDLHPLEQREARTPWAA